MVIGYPGHTVRQLMHGAGVSSLLQTWISTFDACLYRQIPRCAIQPSCVSAGGPRYDDVKAGTWGPGTVRVDGFPFLGMAAPQGNRVHSQAVALSHWAAAKSSWLTSTPNRKLDSAYCTECCHLWLVPPVTFAAAPSPPFSQSTVLPKHSLVP